MSMKQLLPDLGAAIAEAQRYQQSGNLKAAKSVYADVLKRDPDNAEVLHYLGCLLEEMGSASQAIKLLSKAVKINPVAHTYFYIVANMLVRQGDSVGAIPHYREVIRLKKDCALAHYNLGRILSGFGRRMEAKACFQTAIQSKVNFAESYNCLSLEFKYEGDLDGAINACREAIRIKPDFADAHCNLGGVYLLMQRLPEAMEAYRGAVKFQPHNAKYHSNLGGVLLCLGKQREAIASFENALQIDPIDAFTRSNLILASSYATANAAALQLQTAKWDRIHAMPLRGALMPHRNKPDPQRRLRVGYVSGDFRNHAAAYWIEPLLTSLNNVDFAVVCYSNSARGDAVTERIKPFADTWFECATLTDEALAERIRADGIDILVDLSSHTEGHRLLTFARQPAPIQVSWFGFPVSTGLQAMQYRFTDAIIDPPGETEDFYSEKLIRLSRFYAAFRPDRAAPDVCEGPVGRNGFVTFVSFNTFAKIAPSMLELWATILSGTPHSRLILQAAGLEGADMAEAILSAFTGQGVDHDRLTLRGWTDIEDYLRLGQEADIALDPFPFNGGVTTCHALWMGLPVITMSGHSAASRVGASLLGRMGLAECVASDQDAYRDKAISLAEDRNKLAALRASLRTRMETAGLLDGSGLAREVEVAFRAMWCTWCEVSQN